MEFWTISIVIAVYLALLLVMGSAFKRINRNIDDYVRGGAQGTWWLVGPSLVMGGISAFTFTGNAGAAYQAGFSQSIIYIAGVAGYFACAIFLAAWFRQLRVFTGPDVFRNRFGPEVEQFISYLSFFSSIVTASLWLWGLATFCSAVFSIPIHFTIVAIGVVTVYYSSLGGRWAVLATDFIQSLILIPITILLAVLAVQKIGGLEALFSAMKAPEVAADFQFIKDPETFPEAKFSLKWMIATFMMLFIQSINFTSSGKYFGVKDGREARKTALFAGLITMLGALVWFIPPIVARLLYADEVMAMSAHLGNPHEASYAVIAKILLPNGLLALLLVAMMAATMSSMDSALNGCAAIVVRNMLPPFCAMFNKSLNEVVQLTVGRITTFALGIGIILLTLILAQKDGLTLFDTFFTIATVIGLPTGVPMTISVFVRPLPRWSFIFSTLCGAAVSLTSVIQESFYDITWNVQERTAWVFLAATIGMLLTIPFYYFGWFTSESYRTRVEAFYRTMRTPVDFKAEIKESRDQMQFRLVGLFSIITGVLVLLLQVLPNEANGRIFIALLGAFPVLVGIFLLLAGARLKEKEQ